MFNAFGHNFKNMTKEELEAKVAKQLSIINDANDKICSCVNDYIESLPYKVGDKVSCSRCDVCWITSIVPKRYYSGYNGEIDVRINPAKKDGSTITAKPYGWASKENKVEGVNYELNAPDVVASIIFAPSVIAPALLTAYDVWEPVSYTEPSK